MRTPTNSILSTQENGGYIKSFYRRSNQCSRHEKSVLANGYVLKSASDSDEAILSHADFLSVKTKLVETETWEQNVGGIFFGGSTWMLRADVDDSSTQSTYD